ncbi:AAA family ATPase, partial [Listeria monocytogenes]|uniref:AAA family ATPase n=1 Tax=Listeria monocytogenes TaxID=1639 RepID=UPI002FDBA9FA
TMKDLKDFFIFCMKDETKNKYQNLYIDSLTEIGEKLLLELKSDPKLGADNMMLKMYGQYNDDFTKFIKALRDMQPYNIFFTCLNKY